MAIQNRINQALSDAGRHVRSILIEGDSGDANVPANVNVHFKNCTISSLTTTQNHRISIEGGTLQAYTLKDTALICRGATVSGDGTADSSKLEFDGSTISGQITLSNASNLVSKKNTYSGAKAWSVSGGSKVRSVLDTFNTTQVFDATDRPGEILILMATINVTTLLSLSNGVSALIDGGTVQCTQMGTIDGSSLEMRNCSSVQATSLFTVSNGARCVLRKMPQITTQNGFTGSNNSVIEIVDVQKITGTSMLLNIDSCRVEISRFDTFQFQQIISATKSNVRIASGNQLIGTQSIGTMAESSKFLCDRVTLVQGQQELITADTSDIQITDCQKVETQGSTGFTLTQSALSTTGCADLKGLANFVDVSDNSSFISKNCTKLEATGTFLSGSNQGTVHISGCDQITADTIISTNGTFTVTLIGNNNTHATTVVALMTSNGGSTLNAGACQTLKSDGESVFDLTGIDTFLTALPDIENDGSRFTIKGRDGGSQRQQMHCSKVIVQQGGFDLDQYHVDMFATVFQKYNLDHCDANFYRCEQQGDQSVDDSDFVNSTVVDSLSLWQTGVSSFQSLLDFRLSTCRNNFKPADSMLRLNLLTGTAGIESDSGTVRGNFVMAALYDIGTVTTAPNKKDSFFLVAAGSPDYSGNGAAIILQTTPPDENLLDYLYIDDNDIRMFDFRDSYVDVQLDVATVSTRGNIKENAAIEYSIAAQTYVAQTQISYEVDGGPEIILQASIITEQGG